MASSSTILGADHGKIKPEHNYADKDGVFRRQDSVLRDRISSQPGARFPPAKGRYILYISRGCPWAHRANLTRSLKGLEDVLELVEMSHYMSPEGGFIYDGKYGTAPHDPITGSTKHKDLYLYCDPEYSGRFTVPVIYDKEQRTIVNNESSEVMRMLYTEFDQLIPQALRESSKAGGGLLPTELKAQIEDMNAWVYPDINNGVYKAGFAQSQQAYDESVKTLFDALDKMEKFLSSGEGPCMFGKHLTEADIRLYTTIVRFDVSYYTSFRCNLKMIRHDYPSIQKWLLHLYYDESTETRGAFRKTTYFDAIKEGYASVSKTLVPLGPLPTMMPKA